MKIAYIFRHHPAYPRSTKECNTLVKAGHEVTFIGWDTNPDEHKPHELLPQVAVHLLKMKATHRHFVFTKWLHWYRHVIKSLFKCKYDVVHCVDEYPVVMIFYLKKILFRFLIMDIYDSVIKRKANNHLTKIIFEGVRYLANSMADRIIETSDELRNTLGRFNRKAIVLFNSPPDISASISNIWPPADAPVRIAATGSIDRKSMALDTLLAAIDDLPPGTVEILCSGWLIDDYAKNIFAKHPAVTYRWLETQVDYYRLVASCDVVYNVRVDAGNSYYRSLVFPQKIFDALSVGRPVIVAKENWVSEWVTRNKTGWSCSHNDYFALQELILSVRDERCKLPEFADHCRDLFSKEYAWEIMEKRLITLYDELSTS